MMKYCSQVRLGSWCWLHDLCAVDCWSVFQSPSSKLFHYSTLTLSAGLATLLLTLSWKEIFNWVNSPDEWYTRYWLVPLGDSKNTFGQIREIQIWFKINFFHFWKAKFGQKTGFPSKCATESSIGDRY